MIKPAIKYFICSLIFNCALNAQTYIQNTNNLSSFIDTIQNIGLKQHIILNDDGIQSSTKKKEQDKNRIIKTDIKEPSMIDAVFFRPSTSVFPVVNKPVKQEFNIVSSFRENIRFGGFWDKYAIINFNPSVNLKPADFINIYANENLSCFVPIAEAKEYFKLLLVHSAAILAIDNSFKLLFNQNQWIAQAAGFISKNVLIAILKNELNNNGENNIYNHDSYYFAVSIQF